MQLLTYDPAANISTNELAFTAIFARSDAVTLETQHLDEENCHEKIPKGKQYDYMLAKLPIDLKLLVEAAFKTPGRSCGSWVGVRTLLLHNEEMRLKTGKSAVRTGGRVNALYDISEESRAQGVQIQAMRFMQEQQRLLTMQEASFRDGMDREAMYNRDDYEWRLGNARDLPAYACRPCDVRPKFSDSIPYDSPGLLRLGNRPFTGNCWRCGIKGYSLPDCKCLPSPEERAGKHFSEWLPVVPAALPPPSFPAPGGRLISPGARGSNDGRDPHYR